MICLQGGPQIALHVEQISDADDGTQDASYWGRKRGRDDEEHQVAGTQGCSPRGQVEQWPLEGNKKNQNAENGRDVADVPWRLRSRVASTSFAASASTSLFFWHARS